MTRKELTGIFTCFALLFFAAYAFAAPVPDTGQTKCYDVAGNVITCPSPGQALYGQDGNYSIYPMSFTKLDGSGNALPDSATSWVMVKDNVTGLVWEMKNSKDGKTDYNNPHDADNTYTWYDSNPATNGGNAGTPGAGTDTEDFIKALNDARYGGYSDWRMPTIKELAYIVNYSIPYPGPTIDTGYFPNTAASWYWSSTTYAYNTYNYNKFDSNYVRAVRGGQSGALGYSVIWPFDTIGSGSPDDVSTATGGYADNGDGTVTDTSTGLMWQQQAGSSTQTWEQALAYCEGLNLGGHTDWRLPTIKELQSLVDYSLYGPAINTTYFPNAAASWYWSSTTGANGTYGAWLVHFYNGPVHHDVKFGSNYVRAVRGGQYWPLDHSVISVSPVSRAVAKDAGSTTFSVSNTGTGTMPWAAILTSGDSWLLISSGASGTDSGTISCSFTTNTSTSARTGTIRVTASGATGSPKDVTVTQASTVCTATLDGNLLIHMPVLASLEDWWYAPAYWANFVYEYNPTYPALIIFKIANLTMLPVARPECVKEKSTYSDDFKIHIPALLLADGITRLSVDMEYSPAFSTNGSTCFVVTKYEVVPD
jgi:Protein of unknown function (DUF1566)/Viral BACON domain